MINNDKGVSIIGDTPKWMVYFMENPIKTNDVGVHLFQETSIWECLAVPGYQILISLRWLHPKHTNFHANVRKTICENYQIS